MSGIPASQRPFRVWDENAKRDLPHRSYATFERAVERTLALLVWLKVGNCYTIYDARTHKAKAQWKRTADGLKEFRE